jgi:hypothetical protein
VRAAVSGKYQAVLKRVRVGGEGYRRLFGSPDISVFWVWPAGQAFSISRSVELETYGPSPIARFERLKRLLENPEYCERMGL